MSETKTAKKTPMRIQYESIKAKHPDCILFFRLGDFYEMFDEDAIEAAEILDIVLTQRKSNSGNQKMCGVPFHSADSYINKLIKAGCKVAIAEQVSDPKAKGIVEREVQSVITAATNLSQNVDSLDNCSVCQFEIKNGPNGLQIDFLIADISKLQLYKGSCFSYKQLHDVWDCYKVSELVLDAANHRLMQGHLELVQTIESRKLHMKVLEEDNYDILKQSQLVNNSRLAEAMVERAAANLNEEEIQLTYASITAPIDGIVAFVSTQEGETVVASLNAPTFVNLIDLRKLEVTVFVDETDIGRIKVGQRAKFTVDTFADQFFDGKVREVHPKAVIKDNVVNYQVILDIEEKKVAKLRPEMTANVVITTGTRKKVLTLLKEAVKRKGKKTFVVMQAGSGLEDQSIELGWRDGGKIEVVSGLNEGDEVGIPDKPIDKKRKGRRRRR